MSRIQGRWLLTIAAAIPGVGLAAWAAHAVWLQDPAAARVTNGSQQEQKLVREQLGGGQGTGSEPGKGSKGSGGPGYNPDSKGGTGYNPDSKGGTGYNPDSKGGTGYNPDSKGGTAYNPSKGAKTFIIDHPTDAKRYLVHATLEGPEGAVFYRGTAHLEHGRAEVALPSYFESLTHAGERTVMLTNIGGFDRLAVERQRDGKVTNGRFIVISDNPNSTQEFDWEVKAVRKDVPRIVDTPLKNEISVAGFGPYTFIDRR
jgi:hypothetical protein